MSLTLYNIADEIRATLDALDATPEDTDLRATLDALGLAFDDKAQRVAFYIREREAQAEARKAEAKRLTEAAKTDANTADRLRRYLLDEMQRAGKTSCAFGVLTVRVQNNPPSVVIPEDLQPAPGLPFVKETPATYAWDKAALKDALKAGQPVPEGVTVQTSQRVVIA